MSKKFYLTLFLICSFLLMFALWIQHQGWLGVLYPPCPLCIFQRVAFLMIALFSLCALLFYSFKRFFHYSALGFAVIGLAIALWQQWVIAHPAVSCGLDPLEVWINQLPIVHTIPSFFKADGFCSVPLPPILYLSVPIWSLIFFIVLICLLTSRWFLKQRSSQYEL